MTEELLRRLQGAVQGAAQRIAALEQQNARYRQTNEQLRAGPAPDSAARLASLEQQIAQYRRLNEELRAGQAPDSADQITSLEQQVARYRQLNEELKDTARQAEEKLTAFKAETEGSAADSDPMAAGNGALELTASDTGREVNIGAPEAETEQLQLKLQSLQFQYDQMRQQQNTRTSREGQLRTQNAQLMQTVTAVRRRLEKLSLQLQEVK